MIHLLDLCVRPPILLSPYYLASRKVENRSVSLSWGKLLYFVENQKIRYLSKDTLISMGENFDLDKEKIPWAPSPRHENRIFILSPPELVQLSSIGDVKILDKLVELTDVPGKAWAAHVLIAKMLGFSEIRSIPENWWQTEGKTGIAKKKWTNYIRQIKPTLHWDSKKRYFVYKDLNGKQRL
jgi:hypothetical protein